MAALLALTGCDAFVHHYTFYDASLDSGSQLDAGTDAGPTDAGSERDGGHLDDASLDAGTDGGPCADGCLPWAVAFGGTGQDQVRDVAVDVDGNVYITGSFEDVVTFGADVLLTSSGYSDAFVASYTSTGEYRWSLRGGGPGNDYGNGIAVDAGGNVYVTGTFEGTATFGGASLVAAGDEDLFVASYSPSGVHRWSLRGGGDGPDLGSAAAVDGSGNVYVTGSFTSVANFGGPSVTSVGGADVVVASYASTGVHRWSRRHGGTSFDVAEGITVDAAGNTYVTGYFSGTASFGGPALVSEGGRDAFVASFNLTGDHRWSLRGGGPGDDRGVAIAAEPGGETYVTGYFSSSSGFGGDTLTSAGLIDLFVASYTSAGEHRWSVRGGATGRDLGHGIAADGSGAVHIAGEFADTANFGGDDLVSSGGADVLRVSYDRNDGAHSASSGSGGSEDDIGLAIAARDIVCIGGSFSQALPIAGETFLAVQGEDGFIACFPRP